MSLVEFHICVACPSMFSSRGNRHSFLFSHANSRVVGMIVSVDITISDMPYQHLLTLFYCQWSCPLLTQQTDCAFDWGVRAVSTEAGVAVKKQVTFSHVWLTRFSGVRLSSWEKVCLFLTSTKTWMRNQGAQTVWDNPAIHFNRDFWSKPPWIQWKLDNGLCCM